MFFYVTLCGGVQIIYIISIKRFALKSAFRKDTVGFLYASLLLTRLVDKCCLVF